MIPEAISSHRDDARNRLISAFRDKRVIGGIANALGRRTQVFEDATWTVISGRLFNGNPSGVVLDTLATIVGERPREGRSDAALLLGIRLRALINRSPSRIAELLAIVNLAAQGEPWSYSAEYPAGYRVTVYGSSVDVWDTIVRAMSAVRPLGVRTLLTTSATYSGAFRFSSAHGAVAEATPLGSAHGAVAGAGVYAHSQEIP